jgi:pyruvate/2-oxoglutarate dehydrogenase complex dihydrolipoamide dehydrogenase (E3) component
METLKPDLCVIGGGSGGLSVAAGAVQMGSSVVLIEGHKMGGDCLNYGCVPSKALLAAGKAAHAMEAGAPFGITPVAPTVDYARAKDHVREVIAGIEPHDSVERFESLGCTVIQDYARFSDAKTVEAGGKQIQARRFIIATGSSPWTPPIPGLDEVGFHTNETIFELREKPKHLLVIGGGPIGLEMAQAHRRLGCEVTVLEAFKALGKDDPELTAIALEALRNEGIDIREGAKVASASRDGDQVTLEIEGQAPVTGDVILAAVGRRANVDKLNLEAAGIKTNRASIVVDKGLRTNNRKVYAIGDVAGGLQFTHVASYQAGLAIRSTLFRMPVTNRTDHIPWATYTDPEMAHVGMTEADAQKAHGDKLEVLRFDYAENDRARAELKTKGLIKVMVVKGRPIGASIVGAAAGEQISLWALAISKGLKIADMAGFVAPYPTMTELSKRAAGSYYTPRLFQNDRLKWIVSLLARLG